MALILLLAFFVALSAASLWGLTADTRDPDYSLGRLIAPKRPNPRS